MGMMRRPTACFGFDVVEDAAARNALFLSLVNLTFRSGLTAYVFGCRSGTVDDMTAVRYGLSSSARASASTRG